MFQRLLSLLLVLCISGVAMAQDEAMTPTDGDYIYNPAAPVNNANRTNPAKAADGILQKWVHDPSQPGKGRINWDQSAFKSYRLSGLSFRLRFPKDYNPANKYPIIIFLHGAGEACDPSYVANQNQSNRENQDQLFWGAKYFADKIVNDEFNGFLLFPQLYAGGAEWDAANTIPPVNNVLDRLILNNGVDPDRVVVMGLSAGGLGTLNYANSFPKRIAGIIPSCPEDVQQMVGQTDNFLQIPVWLTLGGEDGGPQPANGIQVRNEFTGKGGDMYLAFFPTYGHGVWETNWGSMNVTQTDPNSNNRFLINKFWNSAHKAQPLVYYNNTEYCTGQTINTKMGVTAGFFRYQWQRDAGGGFTDIAGATSNIYNATQTGTYRVHFKRVSEASPWSDWTPRPIVISTKTCALSDTFYVEHFDRAPGTSFTTFGGGGFTGYYYSNNVDCHNSMVVNATESFSKDARGRVGAGFLLSNTAVKTNAGETTCSYHAGDQVWRTMDPYPVSPNTDYVFSFYMANQAPNSITTNTNTPIAQLYATINDQTISPVVTTVLQGDASWKKYSFTWNSGGFGSAYFSIRNNTFNPAGNDFAIDEISLVKYKAPAMPGTALPDLTLWARANSIAGDDGTAVSLWSNDDVNGNSLQQIVLPKMPSLKNNAADNINFNPVVAYNPLTKTHNFVPNGFSGNNIAHNAAHVYLVTKANSIASGQTIFSEGENASTFDFRTGTNGAVVFSAGTGGNILSSSNNVHDLNKPTLWTLSKDNSNSNTPDGNKQDIRENGIVVGSTNSNTTFTGNNSALRLGSLFNADDNSTSYFNGNIAEVVYVLDATLTAAKQNQIESYLAIKYGTTLGSTTALRNYTASNGTVFWTGNATFQNDVFGIGKDSLSGLLQTKSNSVNAGSGDGTGQFAKGNMVLLSNAATLTDRNFLMMGNDAGPLVQSIIGPGQGPISAENSTRLNRNWKVISTGTPGPGAVTLTFDTTGLFNLAGGADVNKYALMIDNDGNGNYGNGVVTFITAGSVSGKKLVFTVPSFTTGAVFTIITNKFAAALPAVWLGFTAEAVNSNALLNWKTSDEINVDRYVVEHSFDGVSFTVVGSVSANNNSGVNNYTLTDYNLAAGVHYYRIRRIDKDGKSGYSDIKTVKITTTGANVQIRPNPVAGSILQLSVAVPQNIKTFVQVMSADGKIMLKQNLNLTTGNNLVNLPVDFIPSGVYLLQVQLNNEMVTKKFIRQH